MQTLHSGISSMITLPNLTPLPMGTCRQRHFRPFAVHIFEPYFATPLAVLSPPCLVNGFNESILLTNHLSIFLVPSFVTHCAPFPLVLDFNTANSLFLICRSHNPHALCSESNEIKIYQALREKRVFSYQGFCNLSQNKQSKAWSEKDVIFILKVTVQFERCFRLMEHISVISWRNPINLYITKKLIEFFKLLFNFYLVISNK